MGKKMTFNRLITEHGTSPESWPQDILLNECTEQIITPLVLSDGTNTEYIREALPSAFSNNPRSAVHQMFQALFNHHDADFSASLDLQCTGYSRRMDVGWVAYLSDIVRVIYLSPQYLQPDLYGLGWFQDPGTKPTDSFDLTQRHALAILAAAQNQLENIKGTTPTQEPQEVSYPSCYRSFPITHTNRFSSFSRIRRLPGLGGPYSRQIQNWSWG